MAQLNLQRFFFNHGEKLGFGLIVLPAVLALATANWVPYDGDPVAIRRAAEQARVDYDARVITPEEIAALGLTIQPQDRPAVLVDRQLLADWSAGQYDLRVLMAVSLKDTRPPLREVQDLFDKQPIRHLRADSSWVILNFGPDVPPLPDPATVPPARAPQLEGDPVAPPIPGAPNFSDLDDQFRRRTAGAGPAGVGAAAGMATSLSPELDYYSGAGDLDASGMSYAGAKLKTRGHFFNSVRGIIPLHELIRDIAHARNIEFGQAAAYFRLIDYQLERQTANANGTWPAADQWEVVDRAAAVSLLEEVDGFEFDPVPPQLTDVAVTMPLPPRITGVWGKYATHPDIESFSLSKTDMESEMKYQVALVTRAQAQHAALQAAQPVQRGPAVKGWNEFLFNSRQLQTQLTGNESSYVGAYQDINSGSSEHSLYGNLGTAAEHDPRFLQLVKDLQGVVDKAQRDKALEAYIKKRITAVGNLILFRYIDFAVEPGQSYRYRARLELENPNHGERVADAAAPSVVEGETRLCAWSNITPPVTVAQATYYFVHKIEPRRNIAEFDFFHYDAALGTVVTNTEPDPPEVENAAGVPRLSVGFGEPVGGSPEVWELSPGAYTFEKDTLDVAADRDPKGYAFNTGDLLVAALEDYDLTRTDHPDLKIPREQNYDLQLVDAVLVNKQDGRLMQIDTISQKPWQEYLGRVREAQNLPFRDLKLGPNPTDDGMSPALAKELGFEPDPALGESGARRAEIRSRSPLRKSGSRADAAVRSAALQTTRRGVSRP
jgi:hypothetical protein